MINKLLCSVKWIFGRFAGSTGKPKTTEFKAAVQAGGVADVQQLNYLAKYKTFGLASSRDMLSKLEWEMKQVLRAITESPADVAYNSHNFALLLGTFMTGDLKKWAEVRSKEKENPGLARDQPSISDDETRPVTGNEGPKSVV